MPLSGRIVKSFREFACISDGMPLRRGTSYERPQTSERAREPRWSFTGTLVGDGREGLIDWLRLTLLDATLHVKIRPPTGISAPEDADRIEDRCEPLRRDRNHPQPAVLSTVKWFARVTPKRSGERSPRLVLGVGAPTFVVLLAVPRATVYGLRECRRKPPDLSDRPTFNEFWIAGQDASFTA